MYTPGDALADGEHHGGGEEEGDGDADREVDERLHLARVNTVLHRHDRLRGHDRRPKAINVKNSQCKNHATSNSPGNKLGEVEVAAAEVEERVVELGKLAEDTEGERFT